MNQVSSDCQDNLLNILKQAIKYGILHIETAHVYGCSELQLGVAIRHLIDIGYVKRSELIIQTKAPVRSASVQDFKAIVDKHFELLQLDYIDLFAFHGMNGMWQYDWLFKNMGDGGESQSCYDVIQEYKRLGKIRHVGFSTHGSPEFIAQLIKTDKFDYVNLHYHFCGSYTASCMTNHGNDNGNSSTSGVGNLECLRLMKERDMGGTFFFLLYVM